MSIKHEKEFSLILES